MTGFNTIGRGFESMGRGLRGGPPWKTVDSFEDNDLSEYTPKHAGTVSVQSTVVFDGSYALQGDVGSDDNVTCISMPGDGLPYYMDQGERLRAWARTGTPGSEDIRMIYGAQGYLNSDGHYAARIERGGNSFDIYEQEGGGQLASASVSWSDNTWYQMEVIWGTDDSHRAICRDVNGNVLADISTTDATYQDGGVGWLFDSDTDAATMYADLMEILE